MRPAPEPVELVPTAPDKRSMLNRLDALRAQVPAAADIVMVGDSLAAGWPTDLLAAAAPGLAFNFGLPGERIQNTLWRLDAIDTGHLRPLHAVILLGTNNLGDGDAPHLIVRGLERVANTAERLWRAPNITLVTLPWRGPAPGLRERERVAINEGLAGLGWPVLDADAALAACSGAAASLESDLLHISEAGYRRLSEALKRHLAASTHDGPAIRRG